MKHQGCCWIWRNYLRVRGEYWGVGAISALLLELPPRARRIPCHAAEGCVDRGNYLRVRGEYGQLLAAQAAIAELPPRARRILLSVCPCYGYNGTTSACAENTTVNTTMTSHTWNYLRVRGEYT